MLPPRADRSISNTVRAHPPLPPRPPPSPSSSSSSSNGRTLSTRRCASRRELRRHAPSTRWGRQGLQPTPAPGSSPSLTLRRFTGLTRSCLTPRRSRHTPRRSRHSARVARTRSVHLGQRQRGRAARTGEGGRERMGMRTGLRMRIRSSEEEKEEGEENRWTGVTFAAAIRCMMTRRETRLKTSSERILFSMAPPTRAGSRAGAEAGER
mmetsp:Transcript_73553/g.153542  ORF Transcript_73553/g.153542 Transcript_73553/m.153542 type:complete len:209 (+) Transcript_73553:700-1326(+)